MNNANIEDYKSNELDQPIKTDNGFGQTDKKKHLNNYTIDSLCTSYVL